MTGILLGGPKGRILDYLLGRTATCVRSLVADGSWVHAPAPPFRNTLAPAYEVHVLSKKN